MALKEVLDRSKPAVAACYPSNLKWSPFLYAELIRNLEDKFGGDDRTSALPTPQRYRSCHLISEGGLRGSRESSTLPPSPTKCASGSSRRTLGRQEADVVAEVFTTLVFPLEIGVPSENGTFTPASMGETGRRPCP
jgi:hypothetical protein